MVIIKTSSKLVTNYNALIHNLTVSFVEYNFVCVGFCFHQNPVFMDY